MGFTKKELIQFFDKRVELVREECRTETIPQKIRKYDRRLEEEQRKVAEREKGGGR